MPDELHMAAADRKHGYAKVKQLIEQKHIPVNTLHSTMKTRAVDFAAQSGSLATVKYLISVANADIDASQSNYNLLYWAKQNTPDILDYLLNPQHQLIERFNDGTTTLHIAVIAGDTAHITQLLDEEPHCFEQEDCRGQTPLYLAGLFNMQMVIYTILTHKAFINCSTSNKMQPLLSGSADYHYQLGSILMQAQNGDCEITPWHCFQQALVCQKQITVKKDSDYLLMAKSLLFIGILLGQKQQFEDALENLYTSIDYFKKISTPDEKLILLITENKRHIALINHQQIIINQAKQHSSLPQRFFDASKITDKTNRLDLQRMNRQR